ncbi:MAG: copper chaperone PCu(A)C [Pseudomonadota bacterium]
MRKFVVLLLLIAAPALRAQDLALEQAWIRALPPSSKTTAGYLELVNRGEEAVVVTGGESPLAGAVEIHTMTEVEGMMRMQRVSAVEVPAGERVALAPGGLHLMLFRLERMPAEGEAVELCLTVEGRDTPLCTRADVLKQAP